jgi:TRAP-type C4-dicarboxylate transport system substrate-binding protein
VLKIGHAGGPTSTNGQVLVKLKERAESLAGGALEVKVFHDSQLGGEAELIQGLTLGTVEGAYTTDSTVTATVPDVSLFSLPFIWRDSDHQARVLNGPLSPIIGQKMEAKGLHPLAFVPGPVRGVFHNWTAFSDPSGFKGMKLRVIQSPIHVATWAATGAIPTPMAWTDVYTALQTKVLDGADNAVVNLLSTKVDEQIKVVMPTNHMITVMMLQVAKPWFEKQSRAVQDALQTTATEMVPIGLNLEKTLQAQGLDTLKKNGKEISSVNTEAFRKLMVDSVYPQFEPIVGKDNIATIQKTA